MSAAAAFPPTDTSRPMSAVTLPLASYRATHLVLETEGGVLRLVLNRPERKNPLTFESYRELTDIFHACARDPAVKAVTVSGAGGNFSSGGDVFEIIGPLTEMNTRDLLAFTRMTGELVKAMRACPQPIVAAVDGICAGAGAIIAMSSDIRLGTPRAKVGFLFNRVGLAGCDMGACAILPRIIGQGRASELFYTGRFMSAAEGAAWGFYRAARRAGRAAGRRRRARGRDRIRADLRARDDQAHAAAGMGDVGRRRDRGRGGRAGALHDDRGFHPGVPGFRGARDARLRGRLSMPDATFLHWPFFGPEHARFAEDLRAWAAREVEPLVDHHDVDGSCRRLVASLGEGGWLRATVPAAYGGLAESFDVRTLCLAREILAYHHGLADFAFAMQGLGTGPITLFGDEALKRRYLPAVAQGTRIAAFALSEPDAGSDVAAMATTATPDGNDRVRLDGVKTWISNGGIADHYVVFARTGEAPGARGLSAFLVDADTPGLTIAERIEVIAPHPLATLRFEGCSVPVANRIGGPGEGFKVAMATLDVFRSTVGAAALGFARRALDEATRRAATRTMFGAPLGDLQFTQGSLADMAVAVDTSALLVYRAAWTKDGGAPRVTREAAMAKLHATESAQSVVDRAVQIFGGMGVVSGVKVEELYRDVRALRIYEGASEVQKVVIARELLKNVAA